MEKYIAKSSENIFDIALTLCGSVEGVFMLLAANPKLSVNTEIKHGMEILYEPTYIINNEVKKRLEDNNVNVRNGNHIYRHVQTPETIIKSIDTHNSKVLKYATGKWPGVWDGENVNYSNAQAFRDFMTYIHYNYIGSGDSDIEIYAHNIYYFGTLPKPGAALVRPSKDEIALAENELTQIKLLILQSGKYASLTAKIRGNTVMVIDWGDTTTLEPHYSNEGVFMTEHCYNGNGNHLIMIFGNMDLEYLDITGAGYRHFAISPFNAETFKSNEKNKNYNTLINEQNT